MTRTTPSPFITAAEWADAIDWRFTISLRRLGGPRPWHAFITHGIFNLGEAGSTTYASRTPEAAARKATRTIAKIIADQHIADATIHIEGW